MSLVDTHCHLHRAEFGPDRDQIVARAREAGVVALVDPATDLASNRTVIELTQRYPELYAALGLHPHDAAQLTPESLQELEALAQAEKVVAIGEIGLDYYRNLSPKEIQQETLRKLLLLAKKLKQPVILHCRGEGAANTSAGEGQEVYEDLFKILKEILNPPIRGLLHCFSGTVEIAERALAMGLSLSFAGNLTFPKAEPLRAVAKAVPADKVVLETDAPFLSPQSCRGKRNEPSYLSELVQEWARIRGVAPEEIAQQTTENAFRLFGIKACS